MNSITRFHQRTRILCIHSGKLPLGSTISKDNLPLNINVTTLHYSPFRTPLSCPVRAPHRRQTPTPDNLSLSATLFPPAYIVPFPMAIVIPLLTMTTQRGSTFFREEYPGGSVGGFRLRGRGVPVICGYTKQKSGPRCHLNLW